MIQLPVHFVLAVFVLSTLPGLSAGVCNQNGWFGSSSCLYQCHCAGDAVCNKASGSCPQGCDAGWFGPACQYESIGFNVTSPLNTNVSWLSDGEDSTCNDGSVQTLTVLLNTPQPLTWVRLVVSEAGLLDQLYPTYQDINSTSGLISCAQERRARVDERTVDIVCLTQRVIVLVNLHGEGVKALCSLHISGGRNMALKQITEQSSTFDTWIASKAVDGNPGVPGSSPSVFQRTCTHTKSAFSEGWWKVWFSETVKIYRFVIYNRRRDNPQFIEVDCCESRLRGFTLEAFQLNVPGPVYTFTDPSTVSQQIYIVVPQTTIDEDIKRVEISKRSDSALLTLCEVLVFGERSCPAGKFGLECDKQCNCADDQDICFVSTGGCPSGCAPGYTGEDCRTSCPLETYGSDCVGNCSIHCSTSKDCKSDDGHCIGGCKPGYVPPLCDEECPKTTYGQDCQQNCSSNCVDNDCHHVDGTCKKCYTGYVGDTCDQKCPTYTFGENCTQNCSDFCFDQLCNHTTGVCDNCTEGRQGRFCEIVITEAPPVDDSTVGAGGQGASGGGGGGGGGIIGAVAGAVAGLAVVVIIILVILWRKRRQGRNDKGHNEQGPPARNGRDNNISSVVFAAPGSSNTEDQTLREVKETSVPIANRIEDIPDSEYSNVLPNTTGILVRDLRKFLHQKDTGSTLKKQFESVPMANSYSQSQGLSSQNSKKNRYKNIVPYDHSRILLQADPNKKLEDYFNASFVKGYNGTDTYIAAQAPNNLTLHDFVRMLWEKKVDRIVMLTNLVELRKIKCTQYWPADDDQMFGVIKMSLLTTKVFADYTVRQLKVSKANESPRTLTQFHFTAWPDKSVPDSPWGLVDLYQRVIASPGSGPLLVHCSAGVGRTGTFIALCHLLQEAEATGKMDFLTTLWRLRQDRMSMIQTVEQYQFLHRAALIGHAVSDTSIPVADLFSRMSTLTGQDGAGVGFRKEFEAVSSATEGEDTQTAMSTEDTEDVYQNSRADLNKQKNRLSNILPKDIYRPELHNDGKSMGTYINAVLVPTLTKDRQDILTQLPLPSTVTDFWRLVTQFNVGLVVASDSDSQHTDETIGKFLPQNDSEPMQDALFQIKTSTKEEHKLWKEMSVSVSKLKKTLLGNAAEQHHVTCLLAKDTRPDPETVLEYLNKIRSCRPERNSRTLYMCRNGADYCGLMCVQSILLDRMETDQRVTVPLVVGTVKTIRPQVIPTVDQYRCLYETLRLAHDSANVYGNVENARSDPAMMGEKDPIQRSAPQTEVSPATSKHEPQESKAPTVENPGLAKPMVTKPRRAAPEPKPRSTKEEPESASIFDGSVDTTGGDKDDVGGGDEERGDGAKGDKDNHNDGDRGTGGGIDNSAFQAEPSGGSANKEEMGGIEYANM